MASTQQKEKHKDIYVDPIEFRAKYVEWQVKNQENIDKGLGKLKITEYLGACILKICTRITYMPKFFNYTYKDMFIDDALENCIKYFDQYDDDTKVFIITEPDGKIRRKSFSKKKWAKLLPEEKQYYEQFPYAQTAGPFGYFTTIAYWACVNRINLEKGEEMVKAKYISNLSPILREISEYDSEEHTSEYIQYLQSLLNDDYKLYDAKMNRRMADVDTYEDVVVDESCESNSSSIDDEISE
jgi:hypothetical protein